MKLKKKLPYKKKKQQKSRVTLDCYGVNYQIGSGKISLPSWPWNAEIV